MQSTTRLPSRVRRRQRQQAAAAARATVPTDRPRRARRQEEPAPEPLPPLPGSLFPDTHPTGLPEAIAIEETPGTQGPRRQLEALHRARDTYRESPLPCYLRPPQEGPGILVGCHPDPRVHELVAVVLGSLLADGLTSGCLLGSALVAHFLHLIGVDCQLVLGWYTLPDDDRLRAGRHVWVVLDDETVIDPGVWLVNQHLGMPVLYQLLQEAGPEYERVSAVDDPGSEQLESLFQTWMTDEEEYWKASLSGPTRVAICRAMDAAVLVAAKWRRLGGRPVPPRGGEE